jgi:hypothetical protein
MHISAHTHTHSNTHSHTHTYTRRPCWIMRAMRTLTKKLTRQRPLRKLSVSPLTTVTALHKKKKALCNERSKAAVNARAFSTHASACGRGHANIISAPLVWGGVTLISLAAHSRLRWWYCPCLSLAAAVECFEQGPSVDRGELNSLPEWPSEAEECACIANLARPLTPATPVRQHLRPLL